MHSAFGAEHTGGMMGFLIGVGTAMAVALFGRTAGFERERGFYPTLLAVIASYYVLFGAMAGSVRAIIPELVIFAIFAALATWGFRRTLWLAVAGLLLHGIMDFVHRALVANPGVPLWWPDFCAAYDITAAAYLASLLLQRREVARSASG